MKTVYQLDATGYLVGPVQADPDPLTPGAYLIPAGCVEAAPPALAANECAAWTGAAWEIRPDYRGRVYWLADHSRHEITERNITPPVGSFDADPPKTQAELDAEANAVTLAALREIDLASIRSLREYVAAKPDAPQFIKDHEAAAQAERAKLK